jgi:DNA-binding transcriptional regulator YiaG
MKCPEVLRAPPGYRKNTPSPYERKYHVSDNQKSTTKETVMPTTSIAIRLQNARKKLGLSQSEAAREWGLSKRTLQHWEQGQRHPTGLYLKLVTQILDKIECGKSERRRQKR